MIRFMVCLTCFLAISLFFYHFEPAHTQEASGERSDEQLIEDYIATLEQELALLRKIGSVEAAKRVRVELKRLRKAKRDALGKLTSRMFADKMSKDQRFHSGLSLRIQAAELDRNKEEIRISKLFQIRQAEDLVAGKEYAQQVQCKLNLKHIGIEICKYQEENRGQLPPFGNPDFFEALFQGVGSLPEDFCCPSASSRRGDGFTTDYETWSAWPGDSSGPFRGVRKISQLPIAWDKKGNHAGRRVVLFLDGHAENMPEERFEIVMKLEFMPEDQRPKR